MKDNIDYVSAIANIATSLGFIIAFLALIREIRASTNQKINEQANSCRQVIESVNQEIQSLYKLLRDGSPLIYAAHEIAKEFAERLKGKSLEVIDDKSEANGLILSSCVTGWHKSPLTTMVLTSTDNLRRRKTMLNGVTKLFDELICILDAMVDDSYSPIIFNRVLGHQDIKLLDKKQKENPDNFVSLIANDLHGKTAQYFMVRYYTSIAHIKEFIEVATFALSNLDDKSLIKLYRMEPKDPVGSRTEKIKKLLDQTENFFKKEDLSKLYSILKDIEFSISKKAAYDKLKKDE